jgi:DeoR/GlpR family transcriptional regulator of sugar metabolism
VDSLVEASRQAMIQRSAEAQGQVLVRDLAAQFGVSMVTIRKDLGDLERRGVLRRVHGGAVRTDIHDEGSFTYRLGQSHRAKADIARRAARLVRDGDTVCIDSSTTCYFLAQEILDRRELVVVTNNLATATLLLDHSRATIYLAGGVLRRSSRATLISSSSRAALSGVVDKGFFSANGIDPDVGLSEVSLDEAESKRALVANCAQVYALIDCSKFTGLTFHPWLAPDRLSGLYTDEGTTEEKLAPWREMGIPVDRCDVRRGDGAVAT